MGGASSSTANPSPEAHEQREQETLASAALSLPLLRAAFTRTAAAGALPGALAPPRASFRPPPGSPPPPPHFHGLLAQLGPAVASLFSSSSSSSADGADGWVPFLRGFNRCCARVSASRSLALLLRVYAAARAGAGAPCGVVFQPGDGGDDEEGKVVGELAQEEIAAFLWMCWVMAWSPSASGDGGHKSEEPVVVLLPDVSHQVLSALVSAGAVADDDGIWGWEISSGGKGVKVQEFTSWMLFTASGLGNCLSRYVQDRLRSLAADPAEVSRLYCCRRIISS